MKISTALTLGRTSNLPTVWTNVIAGLGLVSYSKDWLTLSLVAAAISLLYLMGMFANDAFDAKWDSEHQPQRPIPSGQTSVKEVTVFAGIFTALATLLFALAVGQGPALMAWLSYAALICAILLYDWKHKAWSFSPWVMGVTRCLVYVSAALAVSLWNLQVLYAGLSLLLYIAGITFLARAEHQDNVVSYVPVVLLFAPVAVAIYIGNGTIMSWLCIAASIVWTGRAIYATMGQSSMPLPRVIGALLAGICLVDAMFLASVGLSTLAIICLGCFVLCLLLQKKIAAS